MALGDFITQVGGAVGDLFGSSGATAEAKSYTGAAALANQNAQLTAASTRIQQTQLSRQINQTEGSQLAEVAGAGFTESGSALDLLRSSASQGALAKSLTNIQGAINENAYAEQAGAYTAAAASAKENARAKQVSAYSSLGGALFSGASDIANSSFGKSIGGTISSWFSGGGSATDSALSSSGSLMDFLPSFGSAGGKIGKQIGGTAGQDVGDVGGTVADFYSGNWMSLPGDIFSSVSDIGSSIGGALGSVICTAYYKQGLISQDTWIADNRFSRNVSVNTYFGYRWWASPIAEQLTKHLWLCYLCYPLFIPSIKEMAAIKCVGKSSFIGKYSLKFFLSLSEFIGYVLSGKETNHASKT